MNKRGRPSQIDAKQLADYFKDNYSGNIYDQIRHLTAGSDEIKRAAVFCFKQDDAYIRYNIVKRIRRNAGNFISHLVPKINVIGNIIIREGIDSLPTESVDNPRDNHSLDIDKSLNSHCIQDPPAIVELIDNELKQKDQQTQNTAKFSDELNYSHFDNDNETVLTSTPHLQNQLSTELRPSATNLNCSEHSDIDGNIQMGTITTPQNQSSGVSTSNEHIPQTFLELDKSVQQANSLPVNSINLKSDNWVKPSFNTCKVLEGSFTISHRELMSILAVNKLTTGYTFLLEKKFAQFVNNICVINFKGYRFSVKKDHFMIYAYCAHNCKKFIFFVHSVSRDKDHKVDVFSSSRDYNHKNKLSRYVKGINRKILMQNMKDIKPSLYRDKTVRNSIPSIIDSGNLQNIKSETVFRKIRSEKLGRNDRHKDDMLDLVLMQRENYNYIQVVGQPLHVYLYSNEQLQIIEKCILKPTLHLDATGGIVRKSPSAEKRVFYYAGVINFRNRIVPVLEMINCNHDMVSIGTFLAKFKSFALQHSKKWPIFSSVVTDFSFPLMNGVLNFFNRMDMRMYLTWAFSICEGAYSEENYITPIHICCVHFFKIICNDIKKSGVNIDVQTNLKEIMAACINFNHLGQVVVWFSNLVQILTSEYESNSTKKALRNLLELCSDQSVLDAENCKLESVSIEIEDTHQSEVLYASSRFYKFFSKLYETTISQIDREKGNENRYYNVEFAHLVLKKYLPFLPLWSCILYKNNSSGRFSNANVENWFSQVKNQLFNGNFHNQKCSRVIRVLRKKIISLHKEILLDIPRQACTSRVNVEKTANSQLVPENVQDEYSQTEQWQKKNVAKDNNFSGSNLKRTLNEINLKNKKMSLQLKTIDDELTDDDDFPSILSEKPRQLSVKEKCEKFLLKLLEESDDLQNLEQKSEQWLHHRKIRLTSSNFGTVLRSTSDRVRASIVNSLLYKEIPQTQAIMHGNKYEQEAVSDYQIKTGFKVTRVGLIVHKTIPYLACSPDGLVGTDGIIEVKCPFSIKFENPEISLANNKLKYFDKNRELKKNHRYFYQIQGILNIMERRWCDLFIWTWAGSITLRIDRDIEFWTEKMLKPLCDFYLHFILPELIDPEPDNIRKRDYDVCFSGNIKHKYVDSNQFNLKKSLTYFGNGLVSNSKYYNTCKEYRNYVVAKYHQNFSTELRFDDFKTLFGKQWLTDFAINYCLAVVLALYPKKSQILLTTDQTFAIMHCGEDLEVNFFKDLPKFSSNSVLVFPLIIGTVLNRDHWVLATANLETREFLYLDPRYSRFSREAEDYKQKFESFLKKYCDHREFLDSRPIQFKQIFIDHIKQRNGYNCGVYVIYFFMKLLKEESLIAPANMDNFRIDLMHMLLEHSDRDQLSYCLICGFIIDADTYSSCGTCLRKFHGSCWVVKNEMCVLCHNFFNSTE